MDRNKIIKVAKGLYDVAKSLIFLIGLMMVMILCAYSISYLYGNSVDDAQLALKSLITQELAYIYLGVLTVFVIGLVIWLGNEIRKGVNKARDSSLSAEEKGRSLFWWLMKH